MLKYLRHVYVCDMTPKLYIVFTSAEPTQKSKLYFWPSQGLDIRWYFIFVDIVLYIIFAHNGGNCT